MQKILIVAGTNRTDSVSAELADFYCKKLQEAGAEASVLDLQKLPKDFIFTALYENGGKNDKFNPFRRAVDEAEKFIFIIPEYNGSFPGVLKAFMDGMSYPNAFADKKAALVGLSSGVQGGALALSHFCDILNYLGTSVLAQRVKLPAVHKIFRENKIIDAVIADLVEQQIKKFIFF